MMSVTKSLKECTASATIAELRPKMPAMNFNAIRIALVAVPTSVTLYISFSRVSIWCVGIGVHYIYAHIWNVERDIKKEWVTKSTCDYRLLILLSPLAVRTRLELATPCVTGRYSNQLNYRTIFYLESGFLTSVRPCSFRLTLQSYDTFLNPPNIFWKNFDKNERYFLICWLID